MPARSDRRPRLWEIAACFVELGLRGFGGVASQAHDVLVRKHRWLDDAEFAELLGLGQILPGANVVNLSAILGDRLAGWRGAVVAVASLTLPTSLLALVLLALVSHLGGPRVIGAERAVLSAAAGLIAAIAIRAMRTAWAKRTMLANAGRLLAALVAAALVLVPRAGVVVAVVCAVPLALLTELWS